MTKLSDQDYAEILTRLRHGETPKQIAESKKIDISTVYKIKRGDLKRYLYRTMPRGRK